MRFYVCAHESEDGFYGAQGEGVAGIGEDDGDGAFGEEAGCSWNDT